MKFAAIRFTTGFVEYVWKVPTAGIGAASVAYQDASGAFGSWMWTRS
jgi:hypothetical protein